VILHLIFLHETGSSRSIFLHTGESKITFQSYYVSKDGLNFLLMIAFFVFLMLWPNVLGDSENFINANPILTPKHIQPE
jgi:quinol-cytochrome oxidoreductase complex cytochrome b subunit